MADYCFEVSLATGVYGSVYSVGAKHTLVEINPGTLWRTSSNLEVFYNGSNYLTRHSSSSPFFGDSSVTKAPPITGFHEVSYGSDQLEGTVTAGACPTVVPGPVTVRITQIKLSAIAYDAHKILTEGVSSSETPRIELTITDGAVVTDSPPSPSPRPQDTVSATENLWYGQLISFLTDMIGASETLVVDKSFGLVEVIQLLESLSVRAQRLVVDSVTISDSLKGGLAPTTDSVATSDVLKIGQILADFVAAVDLLKIDHGLTDTVSVISDTLSTQFAKIFADTVQHFDRFFLEVAARYPETVRATDVLLKQLNFTRTDIVLAFDAWWASVAKPWWETVSAHDLLTIEDVELIIGCEVTLTVNKAPLILLKANELQTFVADPPIELMRC
jgi:hypothetical protein